MATVQPESTCETLVPKIRQTCVAWKYFGFDDLWSSRSHAHVTLHLTDGDFELRSCFPQTAYFPMYHTSRCGNTPTHQKSNTVRILHLSLIMCLPEKLQSDVFFPKLLSPTHNWCFACITTICNVARFLF